MPSWTPSYLLGLNVVTILVSEQEVVNLEVFMRHLTPEEQQQLMKYLPSIDAARPPERWVARISSVLGENFTGFFCCSDLYHILARCLHGCSHLRPSDLQPQEHVPEPPIFREYVLL